MVCIMSESKTHMIKKLTFYSNYNTKLTKSITTENCIHILKYYIGTDV